VINALVAADALIVPVSPQPLAVEALLTLLGSVETARLRLNSRCILLGILLSLVNPVARKGPSLVRLLRDRHGDEIFETEILLSAALEQAPMAAKTVFQYAPRSKAAAAFRRLAVEVVDRLRAGRR
jgi:chromosome partitioning protein